MMASHRALGSWLGHALALAVSLLAMAPPAAATTAAPSWAGGAPDLYAIVVGYNGGRQGLPALQFADDDAVRFAHFFSALSRAPNQVALLTELDETTRRELARAGLTIAPEGPPTRTALRAAFDRLKQRLALRPRDAPAPVVYFIYAGHGLQGRVLLAPEAGTDAALTGLELRHWLAELDAASVEGRPQAERLRAFAFIDACRSQSLFSSRGAGTAEVALGPDLGAEAAALARDAESFPLGIITAAVTAHQAGEVPSLGGGFFSHVLASGMAGAADADGNEQVSFAELAAFVAYNTDSLTSQRPWFSPPLGDLSATTLDLRGAPTHLDFGSAAPGRYLVRAAAGKPLFAEAVKGTRTPLHLTLPAGHYRIVQAIDPGHPRSAEIELAPGRPSSLDGAVWQEGDGAANKRAGEAPVDDFGDTAFSTPFTGEAVATLTVAYQAGREPEAAPAAGTHRLSLGATLGRPAVGLTGVAPGARVALDREVRLGEGPLIDGLLLGLSFAFARSSHEAAEPFALETYTALAQAGPFVRLGRRTRVALSVEAGGGPVVWRGQSDGLRGDRFAPTAGARWQLARELTPSWSFVAGLAADAQWVSVDGRRRLHGLVGGEVGLAWGF